MKKYRLFLAAAFFLHATALFAMPILSADGGLLTGVDVGGKLYDVTFRDGVVGDVYAGVTFDAAREVEANAVSIALAAALNAISADPSDILGCAMSLVCGLLNPEARGIQMRFVDTAPIYGFRSGAEIWSHGVGIQALPTLDTSNSRLITLALYQESRTVPTNTTLALFGLGFSVLGFNRRKKHRSEDRENRAQTTVFW